VPARVAENCFLSLTLYSRILPNLGVLSTLSALNSNTSVVAGGVRPSLSSNAVTKTILAWHFNVQLSFVFFVRFVVLKTKRVLFVFFVAYCKRFFPNDNPPG